MDAIIEKLKSIEHGFKHIIEAGDYILKDTSIDHLEFATRLLDDDAYQIRMLATFPFAASFDLTENLKVTVSP